jgi:UDP-N-acetylglucosamine 1-carboxyvinyltransferase
MHIPQLLKMGAVAQVEGRIAKITGVAKLRGARVTATDLRAGAAMVIAGLMAEGVTEIANVHFIDRGYEDLDKKLKSLSARIERVTL